jgi:HSP20 family protein
MTLMRWQPWREMETLRKQMDRLFDEWLTRDSWMEQDSSLSLLPKRDNTLWAPAIEMHETDGEVVLKAQLPGVKPEDLDIQVTEDAVSIAGEHREEARSEEKGIVRSEFRYGHFQRIVPLPVSIRNHEVKSEFKDGVLTLMLPKSQESRSKVVKVNLGEAARESMTEARQHQDHLQDTMRSRAAAEMGGNGQ